MSNVDLIERDGMIQVEFNGTTINTAELPMIISELSTAFALITELPRDVVKIDHGKPLTLRWHRLQEGEYVATDETTHRTLRVWTTGRFKWFGEIDGVPIVAKGSDSPMILARKRDMQRLVEEKAL